MFFVRIYGENTCPKENENKYTAENYWDLLDFANGDAPQ